MIIVTLSETVTGHKLLSPLRWNGLAIPELQAAMKGGQTSARLVRSGGALLFLWGRLALAQGNWRGPVLCPSRY